MIKDVKDMNTIDFKKIEEELKIKSISDLAKPVEKKPDNIVPEVSHMMTEVPGHYTLKLECYNCGKEEEVMIPQGQLVSSFLENNRCDVCGCKDTFRRIK